MLAFPVHPRYARMLLAARERGCVRPVALLAALTQTRNLLVRSEGRQMDEAREDALGAEHESDFFLLMRAWRFAENCRFDPGRCRRLGIHALGARQAGELFEQFLGIARKAEGRRQKVGGEAVEGAMIRGRGGWRSTSSRHPRRRSGTAFWSGFPISSRGGWTRERCVASSSAATGAACWRGRAPCRRLRCSWRARCARFRAGTNSPRC